jgi:ribosome biogenesis GTP-binding protein YsxC/EngB
MIIKSATFVISNREVKGCPTPRLPEYAFIGRSNVGKSSLINMLVRVKGLAKTSARPGKTQLINHFLINENWFLVDLPGYGYARTSKVLREDFSNIIKDYISGRPNLMKTASFLRGEFEVQDGGSQVIPNFFEARACMKILDACSGAGGKTLQMAADAGNAAEIIAMDVEPFKLKELEK